MKVGGVASPALLQDKNRDFIEALLASKNANYTTDCIANQLFDDVCSYMVNLDNERSHIVFHPIQSDLGGVVVLHHSGNRNYSILWDTAYWDLYYHFVCMMQAAVIFESGTRAIYTIDETLVQDLRMNLLHYTFAYYSRIYRTDSVFKPFFDERTRKNEAVHVRKWMSKRIEEGINGTILFGKLFVILHECEHILSELCPKVRSHDMQYLDELLRIQVQETNAYSRIREYSQDEYSVGTKNLLCPPNEEWRKLKEELYGDIHAFTEMIEFWNCNLADKPYSRVMDILKAVKLYSMFRTYLGVIPIVISTLNKSFAENIHGDKAWENLKENSKEIEFRQVMGYDLNCIHLRGFEDKIDMASGLNLGDIDIEMNHVIATYRKWIQSVIIAFQADIHYNIK